jgi:hypothetical protein
MPESSNIRNDNLNPANIGARSGESRVGSAASAASAGAGYSSKGRPGHTARPPRPGSSFLARFGQVIVADGIAAIPSALLHYQGKLALTAQEVWFVAAVLAHKWTEDLPHPNLSRMERATGIPERRLRRYKQALCEGGFLHIYPRFDESGRQDSNYYDFGPLFEQMEALIAVETPLPNSIRAEQGDAPEDSGLAIVRSPGEERPDHSFVARFGSVIVSRGVAAVPQALFTFQGALALTPQQVWFILYILSVPWSPPYPYPSLLKMAERTGYSKMQLHEIKNSLVAAGHLRLVRRTKEDGGQDSNGYDFAPLFDLLRRRLQGEPIGNDANEGSTDNTQDEAQPNPTVETRSRPARQGRAGAQKRLEKARTGNIGSQTQNEAVIELTREGTNRFTGGAVNKHTQVGDTELTGMAVNKLTGEAVSELTEAVRRTTTTRLPAGLPGRRSGSVHESEASHIEKEQKKNDSNQRAQVQKSYEESDETEESKLRFSPYIAAIITDFSDELGDVEHTISNVTQVLRMYKTAGLDESSFADLLFEARKLVRAYQGKQGFGTINNKMAYFFRVLRDLARKLDASQDKE